MKSISLDNVLSSFKDNAFMYTLTTVSILALGVKTRETVPAAETLDPNVPNPAPVSMTPYSVSYVW